MDIIFIPDGVKEKDIKRLLSRIDKKDINECWNWTGKLKVGYGRIVWPDGHTHQVHRVVYYLMNHMNGFDLENKKNLVRHKCDNRQCVNPNHLEHGSHQDNMDDKVKRSRQYRPLGKDSNFSKLKEEQVLEIRKLYNNGESTLNLSKKYGICQNTVRDIIKRKTWKYL